MSLVADAQWSLPHARRNESRRTERKPECLEAWEVFCMDQGVSGT